MPRIYDGPILLLFLLLLSAIMLMSCERSDSVNRGAQEELEFLEIGIIQGACIENCSIDRFEFPAFRGEAVVVRDAISVTTEILDQSTRYCISYFDKSECSENAFLWEDVNQVELILPCESHENGFLIRASREQGQIELSLDPGPIWLAYADGAVAASEGETPDAIMHLFSCYGD